MPTATESETRPETGSAASSERVRLSMLVEQRVRDRLGELKAASGADTLAEVVRNALATYELLLDYVDDRGCVTVVAPGDDGARVKILMR